MQMLPGYVFPFHLQNIFLTSFMVRFKNRYLFVQLILFDNDINNTSIKISSSLIAQFLRKQLEKFFGVEGSSACSLAFSVKYYNSTTESIILRCSRDDELLLRSCLVLCTNFAHIYKNCIWQVIRSSGSIRTCKKFAIKSIKKVIAPGSEIIKTAVSSVSSLSA